MLEELLQFKNKLQKQNTSPHTKVTIRYRLRVLINTLNHYDALKKSRYSANILAFSISPKAQKSKCPDQNFSDLPDLISSVNYDLRKLHRLYGIFKYASQNVSALEVIYNKNLITL